MRHCTIRQSFCFQACHQPSQLRIHLLLILGVVYVTFKWNVLLNLSGGAVTKMFGSLVMKLLLQVLSGSTWIVTIRVIRGDEGMGDIPGV